MKSTYKFISITIVCLLTSVSCGKFLEQTSQNLIIPTSIKDYKEVLQGEAYFRNFTSNCGFLQFMTDDIEYYNLGNTQTSLPVAISNYEYVYKWSNNIEEGSQFTDKAYLFFYKQIMTANTCIEGCTDDGKKLEGTESEKEILLGQSYFTRAYAYFCLANIYAQAYNEADMAEPCVPLLLKNAPSTKTYPRASVKEIWEQIVKDIDNALIYLKDKNITNVYEINYNATLLLATRIHLFMEDYESVKKYGNEFLTLNDKLYDITNKTFSGKTVNADGNEDAANKNFIYLPDNEEIVFSFGLGDRANAWFQVLFSNSMYKECFRTSSSGNNSLISLYVTNETALTGDRRLLYWFARSKSATNFNKFPVYLPLKYDRYDGVGYDGAFRTAEVYLSLAEAYARQSSPDKNKVISLLDKLRQARINPFTALKESDFTTNNDLVKFVWEERRRELCFEELHRWWDLRRQGQPTITHNWRKTEDYVLAVKDKAYILDFPKYEREYNPEGEGNFRPVRIPVKVN